MSSSRRTKEETWTEAELTKALQKDDMKKSDGRKKRSSGEKERKAHRDGESGSQRERDDKSGEGESNRKHKEKDKRRSDRDKRKSEGDKRSDGDMRSDGDKRRSDGDKGKYEEKKRSEREKRKSGGDKHRSDGDKRRSDGVKHRSDGDKHRTDGDKHRSDGDKHRSDGDKQRSDGDKQRSDGDKQRSDGDKQSDKTHTSHVYDQDILETRSAERLDRKQKDSTSDDPKKKQKKDRKERSPADKEKRRREKELKHTPSSDKEEKKSSKERRSRTKKSNPRYILNETFDVDSPTFELNSSETEIKKRDEAKNARDGENLASEKSIESSKASAEEIPDAGDDYNYDDDEFDDYDDDDFEDEDGDDFEGSGDEKDNDGDNDTESDTEEHVVSDTDDKSHGDHIIMASNKGNRNKASVGINILKGKQSGNSQSVNEEVSHLKMSELLKAISDENEKASSNASSQNNSRPSTGTEKMEERLERSMESKKFTKKAKDVNSPKIVKKPMGKINFVAASQKQINEKTARKTKKRGEELLQLIQLDRRHIDLFEMPPMTEYELYMKRFGQSGYTQMYTQTHDDDVSQNTQTDEIDTVSRWCQCSHDIKSCGTDDDKQNSSIDTNTPLKINTARLNAFIQKAGHVILSLFNEIEAGIDKPHRQYTESKTSFSDGYVTLTSGDSLVVGRIFCHLSYSPSQTNMLLAAYGVQTVTKTDTKAPRGIISVWNTNDPTRPTAYLVCESVPRSCCFPSSAPSLVFAGMEDGVICVWDLREPSSYHNASVNSDTVEIFRSATFTTAALKGNHEFPVIAVSPILSNSDTTNSHNKGEIDMSFQLISLDQGGRINIWIVVEVHIDASDISNEHDNFGLSPIGCVKLAQSGTITSLVSNALPLHGLFSATCVQVDVTNPNHVYIGTDEGNIIHVLRFGSRPLPKTFKGGVNRVNAINVSPWRMPYFVACYDDGSISLFHNQRDTALRTWDGFSNGASIVDVRWSCSKPSLIFALDSQSVLYIWDMFKPGIDPIIKQQIKRKDKRVIGFSLANDYASLGSGTPGRAAEMVLMYGDGSIEMHRLSKNLTNMDGDELDCIQDYLDEIIVT